MSEMMTLQQREQAYLQGWKRFYFGEVIYWKHRCGYSERSAGGPPPAECPRCSSAPKPNRPAAPAKQMKLF